MSLSLRLGCGLAANRGASSGGGGSDSVTFGALTLAGAGGVAKPSGATAISDAGGTNLVLTSGEAVPDTGGTVTSGTVTWDDGTEWTVTAAANTYSTKADATEIEAAHAHAVANRSTVASTCKVREGTSSAQIDLSGSTFTGSGAFTLSGSGFSTNSAARPSGYTWGTTLGNVILGGSDVTFEDIYFYREFDAAVSALIFPNGNVAWDNITIRRCRFKGTDLSTWIEELLTEGGAGTTALAKIFPALSYNQTAGADTILIEDCYCTELSQAFYIRGDNVTIKGNESENFLNGWIGSGPGDNVDILNNEHSGMWLSIGDPGTAHGGMGGGTIYNATPLSNVTCKGNVVLLGNQRQEHEESQGRHYSGGTPTTPIDLTGITGWKWNDVNASTQSYTNCEFSHNIFQLQNGTGFNLENGDNTDIHHNTFLGTRGTDDDPAPEEGQPGLTFTETGTFTFSNIRIWDNILAPDQGIGDITLTDVLDWDMYRNISITNAAQDKSGVTEARTMLDYLTGDGTKELGANLTPAEAIAACAPQAWTHADSENIGAINSYYTIGIPGKDSSDTTPALSVPDSSGSADATGHAYAKTVWDGTYGLSLDSDATSGTAFLDGGATISDGKQWTFAFQGERADDSADMILMDTAFQDMRISMGSLAQNARMQVSFDWPTDATKRAARFAHMEPITAARGRFCYVVSVDQNADRACVMVNGVVSELPDYATGYELANALAKLSATGVHFFRAQVGGSFADIILEALIFENQFIDLHVDSGNLIAQDGFLRNEAAIDTAFATNRDPLIFLQGNAAAFNGGTGNTLGRSQAVSVTNSGTVTDSDTTAPVLSSPTDAANGATASTGSVSTDEGNGTLYWVVTTSSTSPSAAQVKAGQDNTGTAATADGSQSVSGTGVQTLSPAPSGLTASTAYTTHFMHEDAAGNQSTVSTASGFTTTSGSNVDEGSSTGTEFTSSGGFRVAEMTNGDLLVVSSGFTPTGIEFVGGGGGGGFRAGGGGGAGELIQDTSTPPALTAQTYTATVGAGGAGDTSGSSPGANGGDTELVGGTIDDVTIIALGGGGGGTDNVASENGTYGGKDGGSGGGTGATNQTTRYGRSTASDGVGNDGGNGSFTNRAGGGGGGSAAVGGAQSSGTGGAGGAGTTSVTPGKSDTLSKGGSGGDNITTTVGANGTDFGEGGGGGSDNIAGRDGGDGAAGIIRIWWPE